MSEPSLEEPGMVVSPIAAESSRTELPASESLRSPTSNPFLSIYSVDSELVATPNADSQTPVQYFVSDSVAYPRNGPSELDASTPPISASSSRVRPPPISGNSWLQDDHDTMKSPRLMDDSDTMKSATWRDDTDTMKSPWIEGDADTMKSTTASERGSNQSEASTVVFATPEEAIAALERTNALLRHASNTVDSSPSDARRAFNDALKQYRALELPDAALSVRKYRSMINAELGLTLVVADQTKHITRAESLCSTAMYFARRSSNRSDVYGVILDKAKLKARFARIQEKAGVSNLVVAALQGEAFDLFQNVARDLGPGCSSVDDTNAVAQALLGSARMAKLLQKFRGGDTARHVQAPDVYLRDALERIAAEHRRGVTPSPAADRLTETRDQCTRLLEHR